MIPPGKIRYIFSTPKGSLLANDQAFTLKKSRK